MKPLDHLARALRAAPPDRELATIEPLVWRRLRGSEAHACLRAPLFTVLRAGGDYFHAGDGHLGTDALRREPDATVAAPVVRASVD